MLTVPKGIKNKMNLSLLLFLIGILGFILNRKNILLMIIAIEMMLCLIVVLLLNIVLYINMDKIINYFNNKYIKWYLVLNKKMISIEICFLGFTILYFMSSLITGIRFIATHPVMN